MLVWCISEILQILSKLTTVHNSAHHIRTGEEVVLNREAGASKQHQGGHPCRWQRPGG